MWLFSLLLLSAILLALTTPCLSPVLRIFFGTQLVATLMIEGWLRLVGWQNSGYAVVWSIGTVAMLATYGMVAWAYGARRSHALISLLFAIGMTGAAYREVAKPLDFNAQVVLAEGFLLAFFGLALSLKAPFSQRSMTLVTLAVSWLLMAAFDFGYVINRGSPLWERLNDFFPYLLTAVGFLWIGFWERMQCLGRDLDATTE